MLSAVKIGSWDFTPSTGVLSRPGQSVRLEHRAASLLELLCQPNADVVTHADIIETIWDGRSVSPNSVAVVIADIRRALGDDARNPEFIQTLPKRGYRLIAPVSETVSAPPAETVSLEVSVKVPVPKPSQRGWLWLWMGGLIGIICLVAVSQVLRGESPHQPPLVNIAVSPTENKTESPDFGALTLALSELVTTEIMRTGRYQITPPEDADILLSGRVILWDGHAAMSLQAQSLEDEVTIWSGMASGPESKLPGQVRREIDELTTSIDLISQRVAR